MFVSLPLISDPMDIQGNLFTAEGADHTVGHLNCPACDQLRQQSIFNLSSRLTFAEAARQWLEMRAQDSAPDIIASSYSIRPVTLTGYRQYIRNLNLFFGNLPLDEIHLGHYRAYQHARRTGDEPFVRRKRPHEEPRSLPVKAAQINQELYLLKMILRSANAWTPEMDRFASKLCFHSASEIPRALSPAEQYRWIGTSKFQKSWEIIYWYSLIAFGTCCSTNELRGLRIADIDLQHRIVCIPWLASKNSRRHRSIALENAEVVWAFERLLERAAECGAKEPQHYLFPFRFRKGQYDPRRSMTVSGIKAKWNEIRKAADLRWFRPYDTRHTAITRMAEAGIPIAVIMARAGHVSRRMSEHYTHISLAAQRQWLKKPSERVELNNFVNQRFSS